MLINSKPVTVTVSEVHELTEDESPRKVRNTVYNALSASLVKYVNHEVENYSHD